jgi:hypothetical protein
MTLGGGCALPSREGQAIAAIGLDFTLKTDGTSSPTEKTMTAGSGVGPQSPSEAEVR